MNSTDTKIMGAYLIDLELFEDKRGSFLESYSQKRYHQIGIKETFVQDNRSRSSIGVLRGLHYQIQHPIGHLVYVLHGSIFDVGLDLRKSSPTFGQYISYVLTARKNQQLYFPPGVAHGFYSLSEHNEVLYKCTDYYYPKDEAGVLWNDPDIGINWPDQTPDIKKRDAMFPKLKDIPLSRMPVV